MKLLLGFIVFVAQIKLTGKGNLAPATIVDQMQNYVLGGIIGGGVFKTFISFLPFLYIIVILSTNVFFFKKIVKIFFIISSLLI